MWAMMHSKPNAFLASRLVEHTQNQAQAQNQTQNQNQPQASEAEKTGSGSSSSAISSGNSAAAVQIPRKNSLAFWQRTRSKRQKTSKVIRHFFCNKKSFLFLMDESNFCFI